MGKPKQSKTNVTGRDKTVSKPKFQTIIWYVDGKYRKIREPIV